MAYHHKNSFQPWSSQMVAEINVACRSKVPLVPDLPQQFLRNRSLSEFEYDFIHERQTVADHDQYWDQKRRQECSTPTSLHNSVNQPLSPEATSITSPIVSPEPVLASCPPISSCTEKKPQAPPVNLPHTSNKSQELHCASHLTLNPPVAARQLVSGQVLQPHRTELPTQATTSGPTVSLGDTTNNTSPAINNDKSFESALPYLHDFDSNSDDPFASAELMTINELEELRKVLFHSPDLGVNSIAVQLSPVTQTQLSKSISNLPNIGSDGLYTFPSSVSHPLRHSHNVPVEGNVSVPFPATIQNSLPHPSHPTSVQINGGLIQSQKCHSSSVPNLETALTTTKFASAPRPTLTSQTPHPVPTKPNTTMRQVGDGHAVTKFPHENEQIRLLVKWAKECGYSESRAHRLLGMKHNQPDPTDLSLEKAKKRLADQFRLVNILLAEFSYPRPKPSLSEQSAIVAAVAFTTDLVKARQFAKVALDLEHCGYPQDVTQSFLLNGELGREATLSQLLSALPRPAGAVRNVVTPRKNVWPSSAPKQCTRPQQR